MCLGFRGFRGRGMSTVEFMVSIVLVSGVLGTLVMICDSLRETSAYQQTLSTLTSLHNAQMAYVKKFRQLPMGSTDEALNALLTFDSESRNNYLRNEKRFVDSDGKTVILDGYGQPVRFVQQGDSGEFASAGADGRFGDLNATEEEQILATTDNLYSSDTERPTP